MRKGVKGGVIGRKRSFASLNTVGSPKREGLKGNRRFPLKLNFQININ